jgi:hypothetical protein
LDQGAHLFVCLMAIWLLTAQSLTAKPRLCWVVGNWLGNVFTSNSGTKGGGTISAYKDIIPKGSLFLVSGAAATKGAPLDMDLTYDGLYLCALDV